MTGEVREILTTRDPVVDINWLASTTLFCIRELSILRQSFAPSTQMSTISATSLFLILCIGAQHVLAVSLSQLQPIESFPAVCMAVWDSQIKGCTAEDFTMHQTCSSACLRGLESLAVTLNQACAGTSARSNTLIGLFFQGLGVSTLCPTSAPSTMMMSPSSAGMVATSTTAKSTQTTTSFLLASTRTSATSITTMSTSSIMTSAVHHTTEDPILRLSFTNTASSAHTTRTTSSPLGSSETQGFGGSGNSFNILAGSGASSNPGSLQVVAVGVSLVAIGVVNLGQW